VVRITKEGRDEEVIETLIRVEGLDYVLERVEKALQEEADVLFYADQDIGTATKLDIKAAKLNRFRRQLAA
jgi:hypothetical protein